MPVYKNRTVEEAEGVVGGTGIMIRDRLLTGDQLGGTLTMCNCNTLLPGASIGYHQHVGDNEMYFITEGKALYTEDGVEYELEVGDMAFCPEGSYHGVVNTGEGNMSFVAVIQQPKA